MQNNVAHDVRRMLTYMTWLDADVDTFHTKCLLDRAPSLVELQLWLL
jgi:hypothetical protein